MTQPPYGNALPPPGWRPVPPPPIPYGPPGRPPQTPRKSRGGAWAALVLVVVFVVVGALVRDAVKDGLGGETSETASGLAFDSTLAMGPAETANNPLLTDADATLLPTNCQYAPWGVHVDAARAFFESAATCLADAWRQVLAAADLPFRAPMLKVSATTDGITTPCTGATSEFAAFYCPANQTIYMPVNQLQTDVFGDNWVVYLSVFAHEYGHHIQAMSGILKKANLDRVNAGVRSAKGLELSRRVELQANCLDGMYLNSAHDGGALSTTQLGTASKDARGRGDRPGDTRNHGTAENGSAWFERGIDTTHAEQCNTFTAPARAVS